MAQGSAPQSAETPRGERQPVVAQGATPKGPPPRAAAVPTASQREAFQRALAKRNAAKAGPAANKGTRDQSALRGDQSLARTTGSAQQPQSTSSFGSLSTPARMATATRSSRNFGATEHRSKRTVFLVVAGLAVALGVAALRFERRGASDSAAHSPLASAMTVPLFGPQPNRHFTEPEGTGGSRSDTQRPQQTAAPEERTLTSQVQPEPVAPNTALPDPPPPALERPGPMGPPSAMSRAPTPPEQE
jgi:hypothetical protein